MDENTNLECTTCGKLLESTSLQYDAWDVQRKQQLFFCSSDCLSSWVKKKRITMILTLGLGILLTVSMASELRSAAAACMFLFVPYMLRQVGGRLKGIASKGWVGECFALAVILLGSLTIIYPVIVLIQEIKQYVHIHKMLNKDK